MKYLRLASDLHIDAWYGMPVSQLIERFVPVSESDEDSILVLAGDVSSKPDQVAEFISELEGRFLRAYYVPGNHEYYKQNLETYSEKQAGEFTKFAVKNTVFPGTDRVISDTFNGTRFILGTLWGECSENHFTNQTIRSYIRDFHVVGNGDGLLTTEAMRGMALSQKEQIRKCLQVPFDGQTVVITHHLPSHELVSERFRSSNINGAFVTDCDEILHSDYAPDFWLFGHTHDTIETQIGGTKLYCNPRGYNSEWNTEFNSYRATFIELD